MRWLKYLFSAILAFGISAWLFDLSVLATLLYFVLINRILNPSDTGGSDENKEKIYKISVGVCILGALLIIIGKICLKNDFMIIVGAMMFSVTFGVIIVSFLLKRLGYKKR